MSRQAACISTGGKAPRVYLGRAVRISNGGKAPCKILTNKSKTNNSVTTFSARLHGSWYQNAKFSDITIKYGPDGNSTLFYAHRVILCNSSEWFLLTLDSTANLCMIILQDDDKEGMEALLECCYRGEYAPLAEVGTHLQTAKERFMRHAKVLVVTNKYMVDGLVRLAAERIEKLVQ